MRAVDLGSLFEDLLARGARTWVELDRPLDVAPEFGTSYGLSDLADLVRTAAGWLHAAGVGPGDRVAVVKENHLDVVLLAAAAARLGAVAVLVPARAPDPRRLVERARPALVVTTAATAAVARRPLVVGGPPPRHTRPPGVVRRDPEAPVVVTHTASGTRPVEHSGVSLARPRRVGLPGRRDVAASAVDYADARALRWLVAALRRGPRGLVVSGSGSADVLGVEPPTVVDALPSVYRAWEGTADAGLFGAVRLFTSAGEAVHTPTVRAFLGASRRRAAWVSVWDDAEHGVLGYEVRTRGGRGWALPGGARVRVDAARGEVGPVLVRAGGEWSGTGDVGVRGWSGVRLAGRAGEPWLAVEAAIADRVPGVAECAVLAAPDGPPVPALVLRGPLDPTAWTAAVADLPPLSPPVVVPADQAPRTTTGALHRSGLRPLLNLDPHGEV